MAHIVSNMAHNVSYMAHPPCAIEDIIKNTQKYLENIKINIIFA